jgi:tetratricopeptide (TPR) repeat protein
VHSVPNGDIVSIFEAHEKKRFRNSIVLVIAIVLIGTSLFLYTARRSRQQAIVAAELARQQALVAQQQRDAEREHLQQTEQKRRYDEYFGYLQLGASYARTSLNKAIQAYDSALSIIPESEQAHSLKAYALLRRGQIERSNGQLEKAGADVKASIETFERGLTFDPKSAWGHYNLALAYWENGQQKEAVDQLRIVLDLDPTFRDVILSDGQFSKFRGNLEFKKLLSLS